MNNRTCFVISPIGEEGSEIRKKADMVLRHIIQPVCEQCGFTPVRVDQIDHSDSISKKIIEELNSAELVIADITGHNPNVFYEMGYRVCAKLPIIHLKEKDEKLPFDITTIRTFEYDLTNLDSIEAIKDRLENTINTIVFRAKTTGEEEEAAEDTINTNVVPILYQIQNAIDSLNDEIKKKDTEMIQAIMQTSLNNVSKAEEPDTIMMKLLLPELLKNPNAFDNLMHIANMASEEPKKKK